MTAEEYERMADSVRWLCDQMGMVPDPEPGVWLATKMGKVLRLPAHCDALLVQLHDRRSPEGTDE